MRVMDLTGQKFGRLLVLHRAGTAANGNASWQCRCDCGNIVVVDGYRLRHHQVKSCGCLRREVSRRYAANNPAFTAHQKAHGTDLVSDDGVPLNSLIRSKRNKSGVIGVSYNAANQRWFARLRHNGKYVLLKACDSFDEAVALRRAAERQYLGRQNTAISSEA